MGRPDPNQRCAGPLFGQPSEFNLYPAYYVYSLPVLGFTLLAVALIRLTRHPPFRGNRYQTPNLTD